MLDKLLEKIAGRYKRFYEISREINTLTSATANHFELLSKIERLCKKETGADNMIISVVDNSQDIREFIYYPLGQQDKYEADNIVNKLEAELKYAGMHIGNLKLIKKSGTFSRKDTELLKEVISPQIASLVGSKLEQISDRERDHLTGLYNKKYGEVRLEYELTRANRYNHPISLIMFDIDDFKKINDNYGHLMGDKVLKDLTEVVTKIIRSTDVPIRYGGEEFVIILPETGENVLIPVAEKIRKAVSEYPFVINDNGKQVALHLTISLGVISHNSGKVAPDTLIYTADANLYRAKAEGKNRIYGNNQ